MEHNELHKHSEGRESDYNAYQIAAGDWIPVIHTSHAKTSKVRKSSSKANLQIKTVSNRFAPLAEPKK
jgi:hypothetical protein